MESLKLKNEKYWDASGIYDHMRQKKQDELNEEFDQAIQNMADFGDLKSAIDGYEDIVGGVFRYEKDGNGWFIAKYNLKAGSTYTMKNTGSQNISPIRSMIGETVIDVFRSENLEPGKTLLITPTADAEGLSVYFKGSTGTHAFEIYKNDSYIGEAINTAKTITVAPSGADYTSLAEAIEFCGENGISTIHVLKGTYDILAEYQALHPEDWDTLNSGRGIVVSHGMTLIFDPQAFVTCHYTGNDENVQQYYSAFDVRFGGATFIGLNISCSRIKYCVHDDQWTWSQPTVSRFIGCKMELDNRESVTNPTLQCIGGGFGVQSSVEIRDCYFIGHEVGDRYESPLWVSYHSSPSENSQSKILITGCYFDGNGTAGLLTNGTTQQKTLAVVANNRLGSQLYLAQGYEDQFEVVAFNNNEVDIEERLADLPGKVDNLKSAVDGVSLFEEYLPGKFVDTHCNRKVTICKNKITIEKTGSNSSTSCYYSLFGHKYLGTGNFPTSLLTDEDFISFTPYTDAFILQRFTSFVSSSAVTTYYVVTQNPETEEITYAAVLNSNLGTSRTANMFELLPDILSNGNFGLVYMSKNNLQDITEHFWIRTTMCPVLANITNDTLATYKANKAYAIGDVLIVAGLLYRVTTAIANEAQLIPDTNIVRTTIAELIRLSNS